MRLLIAEDDKALGLFLSRGLEADGHRVRVACDGAAAVEAFRQEMPDLTILDLNMPELGGLETLARLQIPAVLIHFNNGCFGWIKALQALHCKSKFLSVAFTPGNMARVAEGFGLKAFHIESARELDEALDDAFASTAPVFLDVVAEPELSELPPVYSWIRKAEMNEREKREKCT